MNLLVSRQIIRHRIRLTNLVGIPSSYRLLSSLERGSPKVPESRVRQIVDKWKAALRPKLRHYILDRYTRYVQHYDTVLESRFPRAMRVYRVFSVGIKDFFRDLKELGRLVKVVLTSDKGVQTLTLQEMKLYYQMPKDMLKVAPVLLISALPFANYIMFPLAYVFPKHLLSSHFWSLQQKVDFAVAYQKRRLHFYKPVLRCLQSRLGAVEDPESRQLWAEVLYKLGSGVHPEVEEIIQVKELFRDEPYHLNCLYPRHVKSLLRAHSLHALWRQRPRLYSRAEEILNLDHALEKASIKSLTFEELRQACFYRGLNPMNMRTEDMIDWLQKWISVSKHVDSGTLSLLLHCPVLLAYNHPTNWVLIH